MLGLQPMSLRLIWETGEWDPREDSGGKSGFGVGLDIGGNVGGFSSFRVQIRLCRHSSDKQRLTDKQESSLGTVHVEEDKAERDPSKWVQRETELVDGTRSVGFWIEGDEARVRVELR